MVVIIAGSIWGTFAANVEIEYFYGVKAHVALCIVIDSQR